MYSFFDVVVMCIILSSERPRAEIVFDWILSRNRLGELKFADRQISMILFYRSTNGWGRMI